MENPNLIQNGGFEQGTIPSSPPTSWSGNGSSETGGHQLLGSNNAIFFFFIYLYLYFL
ncbi:hypothetical protein [Bacillus thuringiensis]|uniref:hypothetical protein n=1 Tax=Bacillus thuringiensis TaxID=1428 RepID=UPI0037D2B08A